MTKEEIKALIATAIAGQGTNVDGGGQLPNILNAIVDAIPEAGMPKPKYFLTREIVDGQEHTYQEVASVLGITEDEVEKIFNADCIGFKYDFNRTDTLIHIEKSEYKIDGIYAGVFGSTGVDYGVEIEYYQENRRVQFFYHDV